MRVRALKQLTFNTSRGEVVVELGQTFKPADPQRLIEAGLAVPLTDDIETLFSLIKMPMSQFKKGNYLVRIRCRQLNNEEVYLASTEIEAAIGRADGLITYTADELINLISGKSTPADVKAVHKVKQSLNIVLTEVMPVKDSRKERCENAKR